MSDETRAVRLNIARLAHYVAEHFADLLRRQRTEIGDSRVYEDARFSSWLADEARTAVECGLEGDPWTRGEIDDLAQRIRTAVLAERSGVRRVSGLPACVDVSDAAVSVATQRRSAPWVQLATAAGVGREIWDEECDSWVNVPDDLAPGKYVALNVRGDSMLPLLHDGDTVLLALGMKPRNGSIVVARSDEGYVVKRFNRATSRGVHLESLNSDYEPLIIGDVEKPIAGCVILSWCPHADG